MKRNLVKLLCMVFAVGLMLVGCGEKQTAQNETTPPAENTGEIKYIASEELDDSIQIIDTRHTGHYLGWDAKGVSGHIKNAVDFPAVWFEYEKNAEHLDIELERRHIDKSKKRYYMIMTI